MANMYVIGGLVTLLGGALVVSRRASRASIITGLVLFIAGAEFFVFANPWIEQPTTFGGYVVTALAAPIAALLAATMFWPDSGRRRSGRTAVGDADKHDEPDRSL